MIFITAQQIPIMLKRQTHRSGLVITGKNNTPLMPHSLENGYTSEQFDLAQQRQQINACHTNTTYTNADYSKVVVQLVSLINNIETISSTPLPQKTQSILNQINNIRHEKIKNL